MSNIAYITSGKIGIHSFTHNELSVLDRNHKFILCLTQLNNGPYMPKNTWEVIVSSMLSILLSTFRLIFAKPFKLIRLFRMALEDNHVRELLIAIDFYTLLKNKIITNIHCQMGDHKLFIGYYLHFLKNCPLSVTIHAHELYMRELYDTPEKIVKLYDACAKIITISDYNKEILIKDYKVDPSKIEVMRLFPKMDRINKIENKIRILIVANWVEKKGYRVLLEALRKLQYPEILLMIVGGLNKNTNYVDIEKLVPEMGLSDRVMILGRIGGELLDVVFSACDIFCLPSYTDYYEDGKPATREGIPVSLMEAMAFGKPVISTRHAGIPELVEEVLIEENNVDELVEAITYLLRNRDKWFEMGERNRTIIMEKYSSNNVEILSSIFDKLSSC